jgi:XTP/dITP diphosphohydrolase
MAEGQNGFGYDPIFIPENQLLSFAQMSISEKNKISHRSRAFEKLVEFLKG